MHTNKIDSSNQSWLAKFFALCQQTIHILGPVLVGLGAVYLFLRIAFTIYHFDTLQGISALEWVLIHINGLRFDLAALSPFLLLFFVCTLIPSLSIRRWFWWLAAASALLFILLNGADVVLTSFTGRRFSKSSLVLVGEGSWKNLLDYTVMAAVTVILLGIGLFGMASSLRRLENGLRVKNFFGRAFLTIVVLVFTVVFARGGLQLKPISFVDAKVVNHPQAHQVVLNSTFTFFTSLGKSGIKKESYFSTKEMHSYLNLNPKLFTPNKTTFDFKDFNLVFFILEGYSNEYFAANTSPFLYSLSQSQNAVFFPKAYANGRRSIEGIAALFAGIPALMENPFINSVYATNEFIGLGQLFKNKNYHTSFFHGAENGSMRFDQFTKSAGFDHYFGKNEFPDPKKDDGTWGIYDEPFLIWACEKQTEFQNRFLSSIFTLSSHQPFNVPDDFKMTHPTQTEEGRIIRSYQYADLALQKYFECARTKSWFKKTFFIFVGDHTGPSLTKDPKMADLFHISLGFYSPDVNMKSLIPNEQYAQQIDILPTVSDLFELGPLPPNHLSRSLLNAGKKSIVLFSDQHWDIVGDAPELEKSLKATQQYFSEAMIDNRLYYPTTK